jgi:hypothetical protein
MKGLIRWVARFVVLTLVMLALVVAVLILTSNGPDVRGPFEGRIVDAETGAPIAGAHVVVVWTHLMNYFEGGRREVDARETVTDAQGHWQIPERSTPFWEGGLAGVRRRFYVFAPGYKIIEPGGTPWNPDAPLESTVTTMERLATPEQRCRNLTFLMPSVADNVKRLPRFLAAWETELRTQCQEKGK